MSNKDKGAFEIHLAMTRTMFRNTDITLGINMLIYKLSLKKAVDGKNPRFLPPARGGGGNMGIFGDSVKNTEIPIPKNPQN